MHKSDAGTTRTLKHSSSGAVSYASEDQRHTRPSSAVAATPPPTPLEARNMITYFMVVFLKGGLREACRNCAMDDLTVEEAGEAPR